MWGRLPRDWRATVEGKRHHRPDQCEELQMIFLEARRGGLKVDDAERPAEDVHRCDQHSLRVAPR